MKKGSLVLAVLALTLGISSPLAADDESFVRIERDGGNAALQTAYATYRAPGRDVEVVLYGVVHIADTAYYERVQKDLDGFDTVLYEAVKPENPDAQPDAGMQSMGELQKSMGELLGLTFQKDGIDYTRPNLKHADMTFEEFQKALGPDAAGFGPFGNLIDADTLEALLPILKIAAQFGKALFDSNPEMRDHLKSRMADQLVSTKDLSQALGEKMATVILEERNAVAMRVLEETLAEKTEGTIAIFYGAAHMPDMERRLAEMGFERADKCWVSAWNIGEGIPSDPPAEAGERELETVPSEDSETWY